MNNKPDGIIKKPIAHDIANVKFSPALNSFSKLEVENIMEVILKSHNWVPAIYLNC